MKSLVKLQSTFNEKGSAIIEFTFVMPILFLLAFTGYNTMRDMEVNILKKDIARSISLAYLCSFKQGDTIRTCYESIIFGLNEYSNSKGVLKSIHQETASQFMYSIHTYSLADDINSSLVSTLRSNNCTSATVSSLPMRYVGGYVSPGFESPHYDEPTVQLRAGSGQSYRLGNLFDGVNHDTQAMNLACKNGVITVVEIYVDSTKFFILGSREESERRFYEFSFI